jgi:hypothetical protein
MKRTIFFITCLSIFGFGISHDAYAEPMIANRAGELCALHVVPVTDYNENNSSIVVELEPVEEIVEELPRNNRLQLALTRICISEAGFQIRTNDCLMIYHALRTRSNTGEITMGIMRAYAPQSFNLNRDDSRSWIAHLRADGREPRGWRENTSLPWSTRRTGFMEVFRYVGELLRTRPENPCGIQIDHWGARYFRRGTLIRRGWTPIVCGETLNQFWSLPPRRNDRNNL